MKDGGHRQRGRLQHVEADRDDEVGAPEHGRASAGRSQVQGVRVGHHAPRARRHQHRRRQRLGQGAQPPGRLTGPALEPEDQHGAHGRAEPPGGFVERREVGGRGRWRTDDRAHGHRGSRSDVRRHDEMHRAAGMRESEMQGVCRPVRRRLGREREARLHRGGPALLTRHEQHRPSAGRGARQRRAGRRGVPRLQGHHAGDVAEIPDDARHHGGGVR
jgi:hypothetical protein